MVLARRGITFGAGAATIAASVLLVGCIPILPSRPLALQPISVTAVDDRLSWVQCLDDEMRINYVSAVIAEDSGRERELTVLTAEGDVEDAVQVASGEPVDLRSTFAGLPVLESNDISLSSLDGTITVFVVMAGPETRTEMSFENIDLRTFEEGSFVYSSGEVSDRPCDMSSGGE